MDDGELKYIKTLVSSKDFWMKEIGSVHAGDLDDLFIAGT